MLLPASSGKKASQHPLGDNVLEAVECLRNWQRDGMIAATKEDVKIIEQMLAALCEEDLV
jgi:hypothetical protein